MSRALLIAQAFLLSACATSFPQTQRVVESPPPIPAVEQIDGVPFVGKSEGHCGPSALAMAMWFSGHEVAFGDLSAMTFTPQAKGSLQQDMIGTVRREGMLAIPIEGMTGVLTEVASGNPVLVFQNLGLSIYPQWHYAVVTGYDLPKRELVLNSGPNWNERVSMKRFEHSWELAKYWAIVVLPPNQLSASADEVAHMQAAAGLEQANQLAAAETAYEKILSRWPKSLAAQIGRANVAFRLEDPAKAASLLEQALRDHPDSAVVKHNLSVARAAAAKTKTSE